MLYVESNVTSKESLVEEQAALKSYRKIRWSVFIAATIGYGLYYVCRLSFNVIKKPLIDEGIFTETQIGVIGSCLFFSYAAGKLVNGFLADHVNIRKFMALGLFISGLVNIVMGSVASFYLFAFLWGVNGWMQSMGAPSCVVALSRWYSNKERGSYYGFWSASHNIGEALTFLLIAFLVSHFGWQWGFKGAGIIGLVGALLVWCFLHDKPESKGLKALGTAVQKSKDVSVGKMQLEVLKNPYIWVLALSSAFMYISRYAINSWGIFYLQTEKGYSGMEASSVVSINAVCGIVGTVVSGFISDKLFKGSRNLPALIFGLMNSLAIALFLYFPGKNPWMDSFSMILFGLSIGALICLLGGLMAVDISSKKASGAALGIVGIASYLGAGIQDIVSGKLIENGKTMTGSVSKYDFSVVTAFWLGASVVSLILALFIWKAKHKE